jgi:hypothetical protein
MAHRFYPILGGLVLCLAFLAPRESLAAAGGGGPQYSRVIARGLALGDRASTCAGAGQIWMVQNTVTPEDEAASARRKLKAELDRIRGDSAAGTGASSFDPPIPVRRKGSTSTPAAIEAAAQQARPAAQPADPRIDRLTGQLLLMNFKGSQPTDAGPKAIRALFQSGVIAGALFSRENIQSKAQLKELMKFLWTPGAPNRPVFAVSEIGGTLDAFPAIKDFERWPSESDVAGKKDPQYAYSTYRSLGSALAGLGFNMNFGPVLAAAGNGGDPTSSFGPNPIQAGVFAKTFILGHREENVIAVPAVDGSDHSIRALKTLLVSDPATPIALAVSGAREMLPLSAFEGLVRGVKFCFVTLQHGNEGAAAANSFSRGCDVLAVDSGSENPAAIRDGIALALYQAVQNGDLSLDALNASAQRLVELRSPGVTAWPAARSQ